MISPQLREQLAKAARPARIIWGAFMGATLVYVAMAWVVSMSRTAPPTLPAFLPLLLALLALAALAGGICCRRFLFTDAQLLRAPAEPPAAGLSGVAVPAAATPRERRLFAVLAHAQTRYVITWACFESVAVFGLVAVIAGQPAATAVAFAAAALAAIALSRPRLVEHVERADELIPYKTN